MKYTFEVILTLMISVFLNSCALHAPLSESAVFNKDLEGIQKLEDIFKPTNINGSMTSSFYNNRFEKYYIKKYTPIDSSLNKFYQFGLSGLGIIIKPLDRLTIGISPSLIFNAGFDFTYNMGKSYFLTGVANTIKNWEAIFQRVIFDENSYRGSIGISYRAEKHQFINFFNPNKEKNIFNINLIGIRYSMEFNLLKSKIRILSGIYHDSKSKTQIFNIGVAFNGLFQYF